MNRRPTTQDISWFLDLHRNDQLMLDPPYQRRSVWTVKDRTYFLDTIFRDYPCPAIFLHKEIKDGKTLYNVVDGKQRLETILSFVNNKIAISKDFGDANLNGKKWKQLEESSELQDKFWNYVITVEFVQSIEGTILKNVFDRLNRNSRKLERQELRHAKYDGWFITLVENESEKEEWKALKVVTTGRARRMKDVQFLSEIILILLDNKIIGFDQDYLDQKYAEFDDPLQDHPGFSEDEFIKLFEKIKRYINDMETHNQCVSEYAKNFGSFYTLWALIALNINDLPNTDDLANRYLEFMRKVYEIGEKDDLDAFFEGLINKDSYKNPVQYYRNALGASTDLSQRGARLNALNEILLP
jgi:hypothetical protein